MNQLRKAFFGSGLFLISAALFSCQSGTTEKKEQQKYNVLFIAIDDLRTELNCYGASHIKSPNIDQLAADGIKFEQAHVQQAKAGPLHMLQTGRCRRGGKQPHSS